MKKLGCLLVLIVLLWIPCVSAKEIKLDQTRYTIVPGKTFSFSFLVDADTSIESGSFLLTSSSKQIVIESVTFDQGIIANASENTYQFQTSGNAIEQGAKVATITLKALPNTPEGTKTTITFEDVSVISVNRKSISLGSLSQVVTCTKEEKKEIPLLLKTIQIDGVEIDGFSKEKKEYTLSSSKDISTLRIEAKAEEEKATVKQENTVLEDGTLQVKITVTQDGKETGEYLLKIVPAKGEEPLAMDSSVLQNYQKKWVIITVVLGMIVLVNLFLIRKDK